MDIRRISDGAQTWIGIGDDHAVQLGALSGESQTRGWLATVEAGSQGLQVMPNNSSAGGTLPKGNVIMGTSGAVGDYLKALRVNNTTAGTNSAVYLSQLGATAIASGTSATAPTGTTTTTVTNGVTFNATANQYAGYILSLTYTPTNGAAGTVVKRKITAHAAFAGTSLAFTTTHATPAGATVTAWALEPITSSYEVQSFDAPKGLQPHIMIEERSTYGGWLLSIDSGVEVHYTGSFT